MAENKKCKSARNIEDNNLDEVSGGGKDIWIIKPQCSLCGERMIFNDAGDLVCSDPECLTNMVEILDPGSLREI